MASNRSTQTEAPTGQSGETKPKTLSSRRRKRLIVAAIVIGTALVVIIWGWSSTGGSFVDVSTVVDASATSVPAKYLGRIDIRGVVDDWSGAGDNEFKLADSASPSKFIVVTLEGSIPEGFENGKTVVASGILDDSLPLHMTATSITVGCASKY